MDATVALLALIVTFVVLAGLLLGLDHEDERRAPPPPSEPE